MNPWDRIVFAGARPRAIAEEIRRNGGKIVWTLGWDIPRALVDASGVNPVRLVPAPEADPAIERLVGSTNISARGLRLLTAIASLPADDAVLMSHADAEQPQVFATLRELVRVGALDIPQIHFLDLLTIDRPATRSYNEKRLEQTRAWLSSMGRQPSGLQAAIEAENGLRHQLRDILKWRRERRMTGYEAHQLLAAAAILPQMELRALLPKLGSRFEARTPDVRLATLITGGEIEDPALIAQLEDTGLLVVGEDHGWGESRVARPLDDLASSVLCPIAGPFSSTTTRAAALAAKIASVHPERVLQVRYADQQGVAWEAKAMREAAGAVPFEAVDWPEGPLATNQSETAAPVAPPAPPRRANRSRKSLAVLEGFGRYQREWFAQVRAAAAVGEPIAVVNANAPQEILRALGIPFVVNQWWASIVAAKQQSARYAKLLRDNGYPSDAEAYSAQGVAAAFDEDPELSPWGGLPRPKVLSSVLGTDAGPKLFEAWGKETGAPIFNYHRSTESRWDIPIEWWDGLESDWNSWIEPERLDLLEAELADAIAGLEAWTGKRFDSEAFNEVMALVNEQEEFYRQTRDLVARTVPAPISIVDSMPATMVPQWHRGTTWARDAARQFYEEVARRASLGEAAYQNERLRLMFVGRGVWSDMGFYQQWEESHGAVFVCSMYLSLGADGYIRRDQGDNVLRALAARFVTMGDELRMPTWAGPWHVKEAALHQCDGVVALSDADPLVLRALREAGHPVLELEMDNFTGAPEGASDIHATVAAFLEGPVNHKRASRAS